MLLFLHDGVGDGQAGGGVPHDGGLALVVDADGGDVLGAKVMPGDELRQ